MEQKQPNAGIVNETLQYPSAGHSEIQGLQNNY